MPKTRSSMRKIREVLRLYFEQKLNHRQIAGCAKISPSTVSDHLNRFREAGMSWPLPDDVDEAGLEAALFHCPRNQLLSGQSRVMPDCAYLQQELRKKGVTLRLLWEEYRANQQTDFYRYSQFCEHYRQFRAKLDVVMRQEHRAGEKLFTDFSGDGIVIQDPVTGTTWEAPLFVAVLGASNYTYAEAFASQDERCWQDAHIHAFEYFGVVSQLVVPDNTKTAVNKTDRYEPELNRAFLEMAQHYHTAILPARKRKPKDKAKVETGVLIAQRWILAALRNHVFFSLEEANRAIREKLEQLNARPFEKLPGCRRDLFLSIDKPALLPLPRTRFEIAEWFTPTVHIDYHIQVGQHAYSVPYSLYQKKVEVRTTHTTVEVFFAGSRVAAHRRSFQRGNTTAMEHMPENHRRVSEWTPERIRDWVGRAGPDAARMAQAIMAAKPHPALGYRACLGLVRLGEQFGRDRLNAACARALFFGVASYQSVKSILKNKLDQTPYPNQPPTARPAVQHENIRGPDYYH
jgi:transposase